MISKLIVETTRFISTISHYRAHPIKSMQRYVHLYKDRRFSPNEIHLLNLLDPEIPTEALTDYVSNEELLKVQLRLNKRELRPLTENKVSFARYCQERGLSVPITYAIYSEKPDAEDNLRVLSSEAMLASFLDELVDGELIVKPIDGVHGEGVMRLSKKDGEWFLSRKNKIGAKQLLQAFNETGYQRWIFQELIEGNERLAKLSDTNGLQTIRIVTLIDGEGNVQILSAYLRLICNDGAHDNFDWGRTGNLVAFLNIESGQIESVIGSVGKRRSITSIDHHPRTGQALVGFTVPWWREAKELAETAAKAFFPQRTIGWDVAITNDTPCLIEGNMTWDWRVKKNQMGKIYKTLLNMAETLESESKY